MANVLIWKHKRVADGVAKDELGFVTVDAGVAATMIANDVAQWPRIGLRKFKFRDYSAPAAVVAAKAPKPEKPSTAPKAQENPVTEDNPKDEG